MSNLIVGRLAGAGVAALLLAACAASAPETGAPVAAGLASASEAAANVKEVQVSAAEEQGPSDVICRRETVVGSHLPVRRCFTRAESDRVREDAQDLLRRSGEYGIYNPNDDAEAR